MQMAVQPCEQLFSGHLSQTLVGIYIYVLPQPRLAGLETNAPKTEAGFEPSMCINNILGEIKPK